MLRCTNTSYISMSDAAVRKVRSKIGPIMPRSFTQKAIKVAPNPRHAPVISKWEATSLTRPFSTHPETMVTNRRSPPAQSICAQVAANIPVLIITAALTGKMSYIAAYRSLKVHEVANIPATF